MRAFYFQAIIAPVYKRLYVEQTIVIKDKQSSAAVMDAVEKILIDAYKEYQCSSRDGAFISELGDHIRGKCLPDINTYLSIKPRFDKTLGVDHHQSYSCMMNSRADAPPDGSFYASETLRKVSFTITLKEIEVFDNRKYTEV